VAEGVRVAIGVLIVGCLLWIAGELHRQNCVEQNRTSCSVLPWDSGEPRQPDGLFEPEPLP
jgi:hypothetical protein